MVRQNEGFANTKCPRDCPFLERLGGGQTILCCMFATYTPFLEPDRITRTEIKEDGTVDYHMPPHCDIYKKYKGRNKEVELALRRYESRGLSIKMGQTYNDELIVTGHVQYFKKHHHEDE